MEVDNKNKFQIDFSEKAQSVSIKSDLTSNISAADLEIRWFMETECVFFYKNRRLIEGRNYEGRVHLPIEELEKGNISLHLKDVRKSDVGDYLCQVTREGRIEEINLSLKLQEGFQQNELSQQNSTLWIKQVYKEWTNEGRIKMANSALLAVFATLENKDTTKMKDLHKDLQDINATVLQTNRQVEDKETQTDENRMDVNTPQLNEEEDLENQQPGYQVLQKQTIQVEDKDIQTDETVPQNEKTSSQESEKKTVKETSTSQPDAADLCNDLDVTVLQKQTIQVKGKEIQTDETVPQREKTSTQESEKKTVKETSTSTSQSEAAKTRNVNLNSQPQCSDQGQTQSLNKSPQMMCLRNDESLFQAKRQKRDKEGVTMFTLEAGKANGCHKKFIAILKSRIEDLREVRSVEDSDVVLIFCPIVSRAGTDIDSALAKIDYAPACKLTVLVVLHHTFDPEKTISDSSKCVNMENLLTVDCLFYEDAGLLDCQRNSDAFDKSVNWLIQQGHKIGVRITPHQSKLPSFSSLSFRSQKKQQETQETGDFKYFMSVTGDKLNRHMDFEKALKEQMNLKKVSTVENSDFILLFYPEITDYHKKPGKPVVLIFFCHTTGPEYELRQRFYPVHCLVQKGKRLTDSQTNRDEISAVSQFLKSQLGVFKGGE